MAETLSYTFKVVSVSRDYPYGSDKDMPGQVVLDYGVELDDWKARGKPLTSIPKKSRIELNIYYEDLLSKFGIGNECEVTISFNDSTIIKKEKKDGL